jgi:hypothetical protein
MEVSKKFALNYSCSAHHIHEYSSEDRQSFHFYETIVKKILGAYGSLLEGVVTNVVTAEARVKMEKGDSLMIYKGMLVKKLLSVFKIK